MCKHGTDTLVRVKIPAHLSHTGKVRWDEKGIDACIAKIVGALTKGGLWPIQSCCGHGEREGRIDLADGRVLRIERGE